ncbi:hypothetical protein SK224_12855 [Microbacterium sp. BG28]|uniref:hypothetical protein n=1 Tax=Microbacterium sp. BG28 TaxID=3097356 RepID=UPI002A59A9AA|nr:hypothetical protein [Microbacterium sp. BG28]MDY0830015.1 hypothetical protein [Microbacterium sp. BG28]
MIDAEEIARGARLKRSRVDGVFAVSVDSASTVIDGAWCHRELPLDPSRVATEHARLARVR